MRRCALFGLMILSLLVLLPFVRAARAESPTFPGKLFYAHTPNWSTRVTITALTFAGTNWVPQPNAGGTAGTVRVAGNGGVRVDPTPLLYPALTHAFDLLENPGNALSTSELTFTAASGLQTWFSVPAIGALYDGSVALRPVTNDVELATFLAAVNAGSSPVQITLGVQGEDGISRPPETYTLTPRELLFVQLQGRTHAGSVTVQEGCGPGVGTDVCNARQPVYGFLTVGPLNGISAPRILPFVTAPASIYLP